MRAARENYLSQLKELELDEACGRLVPAADVRMEASTKARATRDRLVALPERLSALLAATNDIEDVRRILEEEIRRICGKEAVAC